ncbi:hypothetical protein GCM10009804_15220 [Kribbella hippodromi]|uniref:Chitin-binding type-3 domain-containing protein n=1 Tax=Kribbella hippodromi TaxID=434347 RepID=A0ABN2CIL7_9ACTN
MGGFAGVVGLPTDGYSYMKSRRVFTAGTMLLATAAASVAVVTPAQAGGPPQSGGYYSSLEHCLGQGRWQLETRPRDWSRYYCTAVGPAAEDPWQLWLVPR